MHGVLQTVDLAHGRGLAESARAQATAEGVTGHAGEVERLARVALDAPIVRQAVAAGTLLAGALRGRPDRRPRCSRASSTCSSTTPDGLTVVDYKTDAAPDDEAEIDAAVARYRLQGASYAVAVEEALGRPVARCVFLFLRADGAVEREVVDLDAATAEVGRCSPR